MSWEIMGNLRGPQGPQGPKGDDGATGQPGTAATVTVGTVTTGDAGTSASVTNSGTSTNAILNFTIPRGAIGPSGTDGAQGPQGNPGADGAAAGFGTVQATVDANVGTPSVEVSASGPNTAKNLTFAFHNIKGDKGPSNGISVLDYGADNTGTTDSTSAVNNTINAASAGDTVIFPGGTYRIDSGITLKSGVTYDFGGSTIVLNQQGFTLNGTQSSVGSTTGQYTGGSPELPYSSSDSSHLLMVTTTQQGGLSRNDYRRGFACGITATGSTTRIYPSYPYTLNSGASVTEYTPATSVIKNIGNIHFTNPSYSTSGTISRAFALSFCRRVKIENCNFSGAMFSGVYYRQCLDCEVAGCDFSLETSTSGYGYGVYVVESSNTIIRNVTGNQYYNVIATGGTYTSLNTLVSDCQIYSTSVAAFSDGANSYGSRVSNCVCGNGIAVSSGSVVSGCKVVGQNNGSNIVATIDLMSNGTESTADNFTVRDCTVESSNNDSFYTGIRLFNTNTSNSNRTFTYNNVIIDGCNKTCGNGILPILLTRTAYTGDTINVHKLTIDECDNPYVWSRTNDSNVVTVEELYIGNSVVDYQSTSGYILINVTTSTASNCGRCVLENLTVKNYVSFWIANLSMFESLEVRGCKIDKPSNLAYISAPTVYMSNCDIDWNGATSGSIVQNIEKLYVSNTITGVNETSYLISGNVTDQNGVTRLYLPIDNTHYVRGTPSSSGVTWSYLTVS